MVGSANDGTGHEVVIYKADDGSHHQALIRTFYRANIRAEPYTG